MNEVNEVKHENKLISMNSYRYILEPYKGMNTRYRCPSCQQRDKTFSLYIDTETGEHINPTVGRCNRESNCGHHYTPKQYFQDNNILFDTSQPKAYKPKAVIQPKPVSFIPVEVFKASLKNHEGNHFVKFLIDLFGIEVTSQLISSYFIGTSKHWNGATVFWQIDITGKIRTGKIMLYSPTTGKRVKEPYNHINWVHKASQLPEFELRQCLFGKHLLKDKTKPVAIVESEKTAIIASIYLPEFIWLAVGSLTNLNKEKCKVLSGRSVTLFPDLNGFEKWKNKAKELSHLAIFTVSDLLERKATEAERKQGLDLADYLIRFNYKEFIPQTSQKLTFQSDNENLVKLSISKNENLSKPDIQTNESMLVNVSFSENENVRKPETWGKDIAELETYFESITLLTQPVKLNQCSTITDVPLFIESHFATVKANQDKRTFLPYLNRLQELKRYLTTNLN